MSAKTNPYQSLSSNKFWKTAVAGRASGSLFDDLWQPKFQLNQATKFITAGSCFAQHISRWLKANGYTWIDSEPAPAAFSQDDRLREGYGIFSFRTGNIYTAALLKQWVTQALGLSSVPEECICEDGRFFDPFRPLIPAKGFDTADNLRQAKIFSLQCIKKALCEAEVFIFTLGLTEAWWHVNGYVYPMCPGTIKGRFDEALHRFVNYGFQEIVDDLIFVFDAIKRINPSVKYLLTVSPVPLTATASGNHVLVATTYSKSVLRAAAGILSASRQDVDYFPAYELISSFPLKGQYYQNNLRSVNEAGIDFVMSHFGRRFSGRESTRVTPGSPGTPEVIDTSDDECEDILLESWLQDDMRSREAGVCLIGDSHMGRLSQSLSRKNVRHAGGMIMAGSAWANNLFHLDKDEIFVPLENKLTREYWKETLPFFLSKANTHAESNKIIVTNIGMHSHVNIHAFINWLIIQKKHTDLTPATYKTHLKTFNRKKYELIATLSALGYRIMVISDPPTQVLKSQNRKLMSSFHLYDYISCSIFTELGCDTLNAREYFNEIGLHTDFFSDVVKADGNKDWIHGSDKYYDIISQYLIDKYGINTEDA